MDHILTCKKDCSIISGEGITIEELETLKDKLGEGVFSELNKIKNDIEGSAKKNINQNDILSFMIGIFALSAVA